MTGRLRYLGLWAIFLPSSIAAIAGGENDFVPRQALVRFAPQADVAAFHLQYGTQTLRTIAGRNIHQVLLPQNVDEAAFEQILDLDPRVVSADLNFFGQDVDPNGSTQTFFLASSAPAFASDPASRLIGLPGAFDVATGRGVLVAVIDSGIDSTHPFFAGRIAPGGYNFLADNTDLQDTGPGPQSGHGTLIAGLIARTAPDAKILPVRVLDSYGQTTTFALAQGIYHAIDLGAQIINISLGTTANPDLLKAAVSEAEARGIIVVAAAGNDDASDPPRSPASLGTLGVIAVAATDATGTRSSFSNFGPWISIAAPGESVVGPVPGGGYGRADGTSFAAPLVSGVAALLRSHCPVTTPKTFRDRLLSTATSIAAQNPSFPGQLGTGRVNAAAALGLDMPPLDCACDFDGDRRVTINDLYIAFGVPRDLDGDGSTTELDQRALEFWLRRNGQR